MNKYKFSLIIATYGRENEVDNLLKSIRDMEYNLSEIQIIIIDQNDIIDLKKTINLYTDKLNIEYIKSEKRGLSLNRNIGLRLAKGEFVAFPDDDCEYLAGTLINVEKEFTDYSLDVVMGRIVERDESDSLRKWPKEEIEINKLNFYTKCSSITIFIRNTDKKIFFNEKLGVGAAFGSCEDSDILYSQLKRNKKVRYFPSVKIYHPHYDSDNNMGISKIKSYGIGFGGFIKSNFDVFLLYLFLKSTVYHLIKAMIGFITFNREKFKNSKVAFSSRIKGLVIYKND